MRLKTRNKKQLQLIQDRLHQVSEKHVNAGCKRESDGVVLSEDDLKVIQDVLRRSTLRVIGQLQEFVEVVEDEPPSKAGGDKGSQPTREEEELAEQLQGEVEELAGRVQDFRANAPKLIAERLQKCLHGLRPSNINADRDPASSVGPAQTTRGSPSNLEPQAALPGGPSEPEPASPSPFSPSPKVLLELLAAKREAVAGQRQKLQAILARLERVVEAAEAQETRGALSFVEEVIAEHDEHAGFADVGAKRARA
eukprot:jgi/Mesen1/1233/ME000129S00334